MIDDMVNPNTLRLIFLHGLPGVGKLTVARELGRLTGYKLFHNHLAVDLVESVFEFGRQFCHPQRFARAGDAGRFAAYSKVPKKEKLKMN